MALSKNKKRLLIILSIVVAILLIFIVSINFIVATILKGKINTELEKNKTEYKITIDGVGGNIFFGNIRLKGLSIKPDSSLLRKMKEGTSQVSTAIDVTIPVLRIAGVGIYDALVDADVHIRKIELKRAKIKIYKGKKSGTPKEEKPEGQPKISLDPDSIYLKGINGLNIGSFVLMNNDVEVYDLEAEKTITSNKLSHFEVSKFYFDKHPDQENLFSINADELKITLEDEEFLTPDGYYKLKIKDFEYSTADSSIIIKELSLKPTYADKFKMASNFKYSKEIYELSVERINVHFLSVKKLLTNQGVFIDSIAVHGVDAAILKDKRYPFNESLRPKLPHQALRTMEMPLFIGQVKIHDSKLIYQEKDEGAKGLMTVNLGDLNASIRFITSIRDSARTGKPMRINLHAKLMDKPRLNISFVMPLNSRVDTFYFSGNLGSAKLDIFNKAAFPAIGAKFKNGKLNSINFKGSANTHVSSGEFTMLYENLEGEVVRKDQVKKNKFLSWAANSVLKKGNPGKNDKTRVAQMGFDRVMYKGFGNFVWKTLQTGIVNTISPTGKQVKEEKKSTKAEKKEARQEGNATNQPEEQPEKTKKKKRRKKDKK